MEPLPKNKFTPGNIIPGVFLIVLVLGIYATALQNGFTLMDDPLYVTGNNMVKAGLTWPGMIYAFTTGVAGNWHPLTMLSHMADCQLFGLNPWGHHLTSVCLHAVNTALVFLVLRRMTGAAGRSFFVAILFGVHPLHVESVAWVAERKDVLSTFFALLALLAYAGFVTGKRWGDYWIALAWFACGLMSKPMLVTLPCLLLLLDFWPLNRWDRAAIPALFREKIPFLLLSAGACSAALVTQKTSMMPVAWLPMPLRIENGLVAYVRYIGKFFYPVNLCAYYPLPGHWPQVTVILSVLVLVAVSVCVVIRMRRQAYLFVGWFWFVGTLVPVIGFVQVGMQSMADRYTYLPAVGLFIALVWLATEMAPSLARSKMVLPAAAGAIAITCSILTWQQIHYWRDSETLLRHAIAVTPANGVAHFFLAREFDGEGRPADAIAELRAGVQAEPDVAELHRQLGLHLDAAGVKQEAIDEYAAALRLEPTSPETGNMLGMALSRLGRYDAAIQVFQVALESHPDVEELHLNLGNAFARSGKPADAVAQFRLALALKPDDVGALNNLGAVLFQMRQPDAAAEEFEKALKLDPENADAHRNLDAILQMKSRTF
jgi:Flp pilus assembly protein TadD